MEIRKINRRRSRCPDFWFTETSQWVYPSAASKDVWSVRYSYQIMSFPSQNNYGSVKRNMTPGNTGQTKVWHAGIQSANILSERLSIGSKFRPSYGGFILSQWLYLPYSRERFLIDPSKIWAENFQENRSVTPAATVKVVKCVNETETTQQPRKDEYKGRQTVPYLKKKNEEVIVHWIRRPNYFHFDIISSRDKFRYPITSQTCCKK